MLLAVISISHEKAPLHIRERVSFTKRRLSEILNYTKLNIAEESVILSTCNRCEFYLAGGEGICDKMTEYLKIIAGEDIKKYIAVYKNNECCRHLMMTAAGLKSMIIGEDQILGQVKEAHRFSMEEGAGGKYLNTLFRMAVTGAKKIKTETLLSKTPVSAATISIKLCRDILGTLYGKNILIIGAGGKTGSIVLKDLLSVKKDGVYVTSRAHGGVSGSFEDVVVVDYEKRYDILDKCDAVISATSSPHTVLEKDKIKSAVRTEKTRAFIDLAVPRDIEAADGVGIVYKNIDDLREIAESNNKIKIREIKKAENILEEYINEFKVWKLFTDTKPLFARIENKLKNEAEKEIFRRKIYEKKAENDYDSFSCFIDAVKEKAYGY